MGELRQLCEAAVPGKEACLPKLGTGLGPRTMDCSTIIFPAVARGFDFSEATWLKAIDAGQNPLQILEARTTEVEVEHVITGLLPPVHVTLPAPNVQKEHLSGIHSGLRRTVKNGAWGLVTALGPRSPGSVANFRRKLQKSQSPPVSTI